MFALVFNLDSVAIFIFDIDHNVTGMTVFSYCFGACNYIIEIDASLEGSSLQVDQSKCREKKVTLLPDVESILFLNNARENNFFADS